jgi:RNA polymerase sigma-70 factor (ECF subfamily)
MPDASPPHQSIESLLSREILRQRFEEVVRLHEPRLRRFLLRYTGQTHAADDLAQDTFVRAYNHLDRFDDRLPFGPWLYTLAANLARDFLRARARREGLSNNSDFVPELADSAPDPGAALRGQERTEALERALLRLPETLREPILLHYELDWSVAAIATHLRIDEGAVKTRLHRARRQLHTWLTTSP